MRKKKWPLRDQADFLKKAGELLQRGYHIAEAIESLSWQMPGHRKNDLSSCLESLKNGLPFHKVLEEMGFNRELAGYVYFAEKHGNFAEAVLEGSSAILKRDKDSKKLLKLMYYPFILLAFTALLMIFVQKSLLPRFTMLFNTMGLEANFFTIVIAAFGKALPFIGWGAGAALFLCTGVYHLWFKKLPILSQRKLLLKIPFAGRLLRLIHTHYFSIQLSYLLNGGLSVFEALSFFEENTKQAFFSRTGRFMKEQLAGGEAFESILSGSPFFEPELSFIVRHGQDNGRLGEELYFYSKHCLSSLETRVEKFTRAVQPTMFLVIALLVVSIYMAILLPMFHMLDGI
ncbi:type II secretion system F family protein [Neobacillus notoginsengisoli]|uniref:Type II secretion system F family protein n=2 Tax=Neobacillus notoginsengisoli TaxID=1578198 RepID=A0A417YVG7_9BACI|nr:type II secretion system F family protein [Neobacillus notoginsengisoli]